MSMINDCGISWSHTLTLTFETAIIKIYMCFAMIIRFMFVTLKRCFVNFVICYSILILSLI